MGTITRSFANNITTSGVLLPASLNNNSIANVTAYNAAVATGGMVLVSSQTASASASISFTLGSYKEYQFYFINIRPSVDNSVFQFNLSTDSGSNYNVSKQSTIFGTRHQEGDDPVYTSLGYDTGRDLANGTGEQSLICTNEIGNGSDENLCGFMKLFNPSSTTYVKHFIAVDSFTVASYAPAEVNCYIAGYANTTSALTNIRFKMDSGNITDGTILMYGIV